MCNATITVQCRFVSTPDTVNEFLTVPYYCDGTEGGMVPKEPPTKSLPDKTPPTISPRYKSPKKTGAGFFFLRIGGP